MKSRYYYANVSQLESFCRIEGEIEMKKTFDMSCLEQKNEEMKQTSDRIQRAPSEDTRGRRSLVHPDRE